MHANAKSFDATELMYLIAVVSDTWNICHNQNRFFALNYSLAVNV